MQNPDPRATAAPPRELSLVHAEGGGSGGDVHLDAFLVAVIDQVIGGRQLKDGVITLPDSPGLGVDINPALLAKLKPLG